LLGYLLVGFNRSAIAPLRDMAGALRALAEGDLTRHTSVRSRDELGAMSVAFDEAMGRLRQVMGVLRDNATAVSGSSTELSDVSRGLRGAAEETASKADLV